MTKRIFTFLVAFLATLSGAVWAETNPSGTEDSPYDLTTRGELEITDGGKYWVTCSSVTENGITISGSNANPTVYLQGINIDVAGSAIIIKNMANPTFVLFGENIITSDGKSGILNKAAIDIARESTLTISENSTGILDINMNADSRQNMVAIGNAGISVDPFYDCGSVTVKGGTLKTNGYLGEFDIHGFRFEGNAIVIAQDIEGYDRNTTDLRNGGLIYLDGNTTGEFHNAADDPEFTLSSPLPEPYKIELRADGVKLEIGPEQTLTKEQLVDKDGEVKGYKVTYSSSQIENVTTAELPETKFVGSAYKVETWDDKANNSSDPSTTYEHIDQWWWEKNGSSWVEAESAVGALGDYTTLSNIPTKDYQAVWYLKEKSITINLTGDEGQFVGSFPLWYPEQPEMLLTATEQTSGALADVGLALSEEDGRTISSIEELGTADEGEHEVKLTLAATAGSNKPSDLTTTLNVNVIIEKYTSDEVTASVKTNASGDLTYDGASQKEEITVEVKPTSGTGGAIASRFYSVVFKKQNTDGTYGEEQEDIRDAGTYQVIVKATDVTNQVLEDGFEKEAGTVTIKPATLTIAEVSNVEWTIGETEPNYKEEAEFALNKIYSVGEALDDVSINKDATGFDGSVTGNTWETTPGTYTVNYSGLELTGSRAENYTLNNVTTAEGKLIVSVEGTTEDPIDDEGDNPLISATGDWADGTRGYDGKEHPLTEIEVKNGTETATISLADVTITYSYQQTAEAEATTPKAVKNAGSYTATFTFPDNKYGYKGTGKVSLEITKADFTISAGTNNTITVEQNADISQLNAADYITISGVEVEGVKETPTISGYLTPNEGVSTTEKNETGIENAFNFKNVEVKDGDNCLLSNYNEITTWPEIKLIVGPIKLNPDTDGSGDGDDEVIGGEDADRDGTFPTDGDIIILATGDAEVQNNVYDGNAHTLALLKIGEYTLAETTDYSVEYDSDDTPSLNDKDLPFHAATYSAEITLNGDSPYELEDGSKEFSLEGIKIAQRQMMVSFVKVVSSVEDLNDINKLVQFEKMAGYRGLVDGEEPTVEATIETKDLGDGHYQVTIPRESFKISDSDNFYLSDYLAKVDFDGDGEGNADITDGDGDGTGDIDDGDEDIVIVITVDPDGSGDGGQGTVDIPKYYNIYEDEICEGVTVEFSRDVVREGQSVVVTVKVDDEFDVEDLTLQFKRSLFGTWEDLTLTPTENPNEYIIKNIYTDIYVRAEGAVPTGIESIDGAKVYTKDGSLFVQTPQLENVTIVTITGAIVKSEQQVGLKQYTGLQRGIYVVRVGEQVFKVRN